MGKVARKGYSADFKQGRVWTMWLVISPSNPTELLPAASRDLGELDT